MKTVVTDLDGTILVHGDLPEGTIRSLKKFQEKNRLILASGRSLEHMKRFVDALEMDSFQTGGLIGLNGMERYDFKTKTYVKEKGIDPRLVFPLAQEFQNDCALVLVDRGTKEWKISTHLSWLCILNPWKRLRTLAAQPTYQIGQEPIDKMILLFYVGSEKKLQQVRFRYPALQILKVSRFWIEIIPSRIDKSLQVRHFMDQYEIDPKDLYVFGDGENDLKMLELTCHSYAPESAMKKIKEKAHHLCDAPQKEGVKTIIDSL